MNELSTVLFSVLGTLLPTCGIGGLMYWRQNRRLKDAEVLLAEVNVDKAKVESKAEEWRIWQEQLEAERRHVQFTDERIEQLLQINAGKEDRHQQDIKDWEERFDKAVDRTREVQRENAKLAQDKIDLIQENGDLKLELAKKRCDDLPCPFRLPPTGYTIPAVEKSKEDYLREKRAAEAEVESVKS